MEISAGASILFSLSLLGMEVKSEKGVSGLSSLFTHSTRAGRSICLSPQRKASIFSLVPVMYISTRRRVLYRACQFQFFCHAADGRTETDTLHSAGHAEPFRHLMFHTRLPKNYFFEIFISHSAAASYPSPVFPHTLNTGASLFKWRIPSIKNSSSKSR